MAEMKVVRLVVTMVAHLADEKTGLMVFGLAESSVDMRVSQLVEKMDVSLAVAMAALKDIATVG